MTAGLGLVLFAQSKDALKDADRHFKEKSYAIALKEYEAALKSGQVAANRKDEIAYRILVSESRSEQWDRAVPDTLAFIKARKGTVWEARGLYWLGRLYLGATHEGYRIGDKLTRGADVPKSAFDKKPQQIERSELDSQDAREALEAAAALYSRNRFPNSLVEETQLCFDLAFILNSDARFETWGNEKRWLPLKVEEWRIDPKAEFNPDWATPKKQLYLYTHIQSLNSTSPAHASAQAQFMKSEALQRYHESMKNRFAYDIVKGKRVELSYPFQELTQESALRELVSRFPNDPLRDPSQLRIAALLYQKNQRADAMRELKTFVATRPQSKWVSDAKAQMQEIASPYFELTTPDVSLGETRISGSFVSKNLKSVHLSLYNLNLRQLLIRPQDKNDSNWGNLNAYDSLILGNRNRILFPPYLVHDSNCDTKYRSTFFENFVSSDDAVSTQCRLTLLASLRERKVIERMQFTNYLNL